MKVCGFRRRIRSRPMRPSATKLRNFLPHGPKSCASASTSAPITPTLCRWSAYFAPGLPRPTQSCIFPLHFRGGAGGGACQGRALRPPHPSIPSPEVEGKPLFFLAALGRCAALGSFLALGAFLAFEKLGFRGSGSGSGFFFLFGL